MLGLLVLAVDDHTVWDPRVKLLNVTGTEPNSDLVRRINVCLGDFGESATRRDLNSLHAKHEDLVFQLQRSKLAQKRIKRLRIYRNYNNISIFEASNVG